MRIGIEAQRIFRKKKHGMDIVILEVLRELQQLNTPHEYFVYAQPDEDMQALSNSANTHLHITKPALYPVWEQSLLPKAGRKDNIDLLHCTSNTAPIGSSVPLVVTIHDIIYLEKWMIREGTYYQRFGNLYRRWNVPRIASKAEIIITVSDYERERIIEGLNISPDKVRTVYNACGKHFTPERNEAELLAFQKKMGLPDKFILFLGNTDPKKNLPNVMKALDILHQRGQLDFKMVMPDFGKEHLYALLKLQNSEYLLNHIMLTGYIPNKELPNLYRLAQLFLYPSLRESFGIPILEAMSCGTPLITSNTSAMPEVAGNGALLVDPTQPEQIAEKIIKVLTDNEIRKTSIDYGIKRAAMFSWQKTAQEVVSIYNEVLA
ncbi:glycosyltransferase family 1 protein [Emticicia sp. TH156]|uniref:glycosyltransferase family 4 protein n=1 Tax=Emticicia sp. TH156 TaxID=2067454 RepID=UPI000C769E52|nr:glycosyltransferase family 1 protein [Emticicia sp. TH156]PLK45501.1 group 1 glycosyl transferase [Emticicia sp. TH156]